MQQVMARGGRPILIVDETVPEADIADVQHVVRVPRTVDCLQNILTVIPLQMLAYHVADLNGFNVNNLKIEFLKDQNPFNSGRSSAQFG